MDVTIPYSYVESQVPPRCRKPRLVRLEASATVTIAELTGAQVPVACTVAWTGTPPPRQAPLEVYCSWEGRTYTASLELLGRILHPEPSHRESWISGQQSIAEQYGDYLLIDGMPWEQSDLPRYYVRTYGFGHNHGGTRLKLGHPQDGERSFALLDRKAALAATEEIARERGDTGSLPASCDAQVTILRPDLLGESGPQSFLVPLTVEATLLVRVTDYSKAGAAYRALAEYERKTPAVLAGEGTVTLGRAQLPEPELIQRAP